MMHNWYLCDLWKCDVWYLSESPGILPPHEVELHWHGEQQGSQVGHGEVEQVDVGGGPHVLVSHDHKTSRQISHKSQNKK